MIKSTQKLMTSLEIPTVYRHKTPQRMRGGHFAPDNARRALIGQFRSRDHCLYTQNTGSCAKPEVAPPQRRALYTIPHTAYLVFSGPASTIFEIL